LQWKCVCIKNLVVSQGYIRLPLVVEFGKFASDACNSKIIDIARELAEWGIKVKVVDPWEDTKEAQDEYGLQLMQATPQTPVESLMVAVAHTLLAQMELGGLVDLCVTKGKFMITGIKSLYSRKELNLQGFMVFRF